MSKRSLVYVELSEGAGKEEGQGYPTPRKAMSDNGPRNKEKYETLMDSKHPTPNFVYTYH